MKHFVFALIVLVVIVSTCLAEGQTCVEGETTKVDCNTCRCRNGRLACTKKHCIERTKRETCVDGETKKEDCNNCVCSNNRWACTYKLCIH